MQRQRTVGLPRLPSAAAAEAGSGPVVVTTSEQPSAGHGHATYLAWVLGLQDEGARAYANGLPLPDQDADASAHRRSGWSRAWDQDHASDPACGDISKHSPGRPCTRPAGHPLSHKNGTRGWGTPASATNGIDS
jgi:hypothetical protein